MKTRENGYSHDWKHLGEHNRCLSQILVENSGLIFICRIPNKSGLEDTKGSIRWLLEFTSLQHLRSYQDKHRLVTVCTNGDFIVLPHWEISPWVP